MTEKDAPSAGPAQEPALTNPVFQTEGFRKALGAASKMQLRAGEAILVQGRAGKAAFFIASGEVEVLSETSYGAVRLASLAAPRLVGEVGAFAGLARTASVRALTDVTVYRIAREELVALGRAEPDLLLSVIADLGRQLEGFNRTISLYANALEALEHSEFDARILDDLNNPPPQAAAFTQAFHRFAKQILSKRRQEEEMASAAAIQRSFLPSRSALESVADCIDLEAMVLPTREVGGDFYDYFMLDSERLVFLLGDVCGKGLPASLFAAIVVTVLRTTLRDELQLGPAVKRANAILCRDNAACLFATLFIGVLDTRTGALEYCNCGHNAPLLVNAEKITPLPATGLPIAMLDDRVAATANIQLAIADTLVVYSDGVTEALNVDSQEFGDENLEKVVRLLSNDGAKDGLKRVIDSVNAFAGEAQQADDITCMVVQMRALRGAA